MQRDTRTTFNQPNRSTPTQANRTVGGQYRAVNGQSRTASGQSRTTSSQVNRTTPSQAGGAGSQPNTVNNVNANAVTCRKCKSQQIVANKRGYSFANMFITLGWMALLPLILVIGGTLGATYLMMNMDVSIGGSGTSSVSGGAFDAVIAIIGIMCWISFSLSLPVSILVGFIGRSEIVNGCMNCGFKWRPGKKK